MTNEGRGMAERGAGGTARGASGTGEALAGRLGQRSASTFAAGWHANLVFTSLPAPATAPLYIGVTSDLPTRVWTHKQDLVEGFTKRYGVHTLVWYELHDSMADAITREKQLKRWKRDWKFRLIREFNPGWRDLYEDLA